MFLKWGDTRRDTPRHASDNRPRLFFFSFFLLVLCWSQVSSFLIQNICSSRCAEDYCSANFQSFFSPTSMSAMYTLLTLLHLTLDSVAWIALADRMSPYASEGLKCACSFGLVLSSSCLSPWEEHATDTDILRKMRDVEQAWTKPAARSQAQLSPTLISWVYRFVREQHIAVRTLIFLGSFLSIIALVIIN